MTRPDEPHVHTEACLGGTERGDKLRCEQEASWLEPPEAWADKQLFSDADDVDLYLDMERGK